MSIKIVIICLITTVNCEKFEITSGAYFRDLPDITPYEVPLPILFEINLQSNSCNNVKCDQNTFECQLLEKFQNLGIDVNSLIVEQSLLSSDGQLTGWSFQLLERNHIKRMFTNKHEYQNLRAKIISRPYNFKINKINLINNTFQCNMKQNNSLLTYLDLKNKIQDTITGCFSRKTHPSIIKLEYILTALNELKILVSQNNRKPTIQNAARYFTLPVTECLITFDKILLAIHVPLIRQNIKKIKLLNFVPIKLTWENFACEIDSKQLDIAVVSLTTKNDNEIYSLKCNPFKDELCLIDNDYEDNIVGILCAKHVLHGSTAENLAKFCPFKCQNSEINSKIITKLTSTNFILTNERENFKITCDREITTYNFSVTYGALDIKLPCNCKLLLSNGETLKPDYPCLDRETELDIKRILPSAWINLKGLVIPPYDVKKFPTLENLDKALNKEAILTNSINKSNVEMISIYVLYTLVILCNITFISVFVYLNRMFKNNLAKKDINSQTYLKGFSVSTTTVGRQRNNPNLARRPLPFPRTESESEYILPNTAAMLGTHGSGNNDNNHEYVNMELFQ